MNIRELIEKKLRADELALSLPKIKTDKIFNYVGELDLEIVDLERKLANLKYIHEVYKGFEELGITTRKELSDKVYEYALELAKSTKDGNHILDLLYNASKDGSDKAKIEYARIVAYGLYGVKSSIIEAYDWLEKLANENNPEACYCITLLHYDFPEAIEAQVAYDYCQKAAGLGYPPAQRRLSQPFDLRTYTEKLLDQANKGHKELYFDLAKRQDLSAELREEYMRLAIENNDPRAEYAYALAAIEEGLIDDAKSYLAAAGSHGYSDAYVDLGQLMIPENGENYYNYSKLDVTLLPQNYHLQEFECYKKACEMNNLQAMVYVGIAYKQGYVVNQDYEMAFNLFAKAVELGDEFYASFHLAECYELGIGTEIDENAAVLYYSMGAEKGNINSMLALARIYKEGLRTIEKNDELSSRYYFMSGIGRD